MTKQDTALTVEADGRAMIPLFRLKKSEQNVRKVPHSSASLDALAASIRVRGIMQNLVVEPELDDNKRPTGYYLVTAGEGRRLAQLRRLDAKEIKKTEPLPCLIDVTNNARETSLDENISREAMHPADQYEAFKTLADEQGFSDEDIAKRFGITVQIVRKRLKLGAISPRLMALYREDKLRLDQMMAFTLTDDQDRQEQVYDQLYPNNLYPRSIKVCLTETQMRADAPVAKFVGEDRYRAAGGEVLSDLFSEDIFFTDPAMVERLALEILTQQAIDLQYTEGWKWYEVALAYRSPDYEERIYAEETPLTAEEDADWQAKADEYDNIVAEYEGEDEFPDEVSERLNVLDKAIDALNAKRRAFAPQKVSRAGIFLCLNHDGGLRIERGFVRAEDQELQEPETQEESETGLVVAPATEDEGDDQPALPDSLLRDLTAHRTIALRLTLGDRPEIALIAATHAMALQLFYGSYDNQGIELRATQSSQTSYAQGIDETGSAQAVRDRHDRLDATLPEDKADLWAFLAALPSPDLMTVFAHCVSQTVNVTRHPHDRRPRLGTEELPTAVALDMSKHWQPTSDAYFGRVTKKQILADVTEARGPKEALNIDPLKKGDMAARAEALVKETDWLPTPLRTLTA